MNSSASCPGKVHLIGEHSVVYGKPAILAAIDRKVFCSVSKTKKISIVSRGFGRLSSTPEKCLAFGKRLTELHEKNDFKALFKESRKSPSSSLMAIAGKAALELGIDGGFRASIRSEVPPNSGLGSSAALSLAFAKSLAANFSIKLGKKRLLETSNSIEKIFHGRPSGADAAACRIGGFVWFKKGKASSIEGSRIKIIAVNTPRISTTGEMVSKVSKLEKRKRDGIMDSLEDLAMEMRKALSHGETGKITEVFNNAQELLSSLGVGTQETDEICSIVVEEGGGAKISGAGGGGHVICVGEDIEAISKALRKKLYRTETFKLGERGLR